MGSGTLGLPTLKALHAAHNVSLVISQPDKPAGRKRKLTPTPIAAWSHGVGLNVIKPEKCGSEDVLRAVSDADPDVIFVAAYGQYIPTKLLALARLGEMNLHPSLLPRWRGAAPVQYTLLSGDSECGNSLIRVAKEMDTGDILAQTRYPVDPNATAGELHDSLAEDAADLVIDTLERMEKGTLDHPIVQNDALATHAHKFTKEDAYVDFTQDAESVRCRVHGLNPWPGVTMAWRGPDDTTHELKICRACDLPDHAHSADPGTVIDHGVVACGSGAVRLLEVQAPGKRVMAWSDYVAGHSVPVGSVFERKSD